MFTGKKYTPGWYVEYREMDNTPVFAKEGAIIPMLVNEDTNTLVFENLEIKVFAGENKYTLYDEIGQIDFEIKKEKETYILDIEKSKDMITKSILVNFVDLPSGEVALNGKKIAKGKKVKVNF